MNLRSQLKIYLERSGMTATKLSKISGVPNTTISDWLAGRLPRNLEQVKRVAVALGTSIDHLAFGTGFEAGQPTPVSLDEFFDDKWMEGTFEIKLRRLKK